MPAPKSLPLSTKRMKVPFVTLIPIARRPPSTDLRSIHELILGAEIHTIWRKYRKV